MKTRNPAVAGVFYPAHTSDLVQIVDGFLASTDTPPRKVYVAVSPHAGYVYSGPVAGELFGQVNVPRRVMILGPKHRHGGSQAAVSPPGTWRFPFGSVPIDEELCDAVIRETQVVRDEVAHRDEHSLEVQVPFLWRRNPEIELTPIALGMHRLEDLQEMGRGIGRAIEKIAEPVLIVASTDMSHQIPLAQAERLDRMAIQRILELDPEGLFQTVMSHRISMCGIIPTTVSLYAAKQLGAGSAKLIRYTTSADATGDTSHVVGYAGLTIE